MSEARSRRRRRSFRFALLTAALLLSASAGAGLVLLVSDPSPGEVVTAPLPDPAAAGLVSSSPRETAAKRSTAAAQGDLTVLEQLSRWREFRATQPGNRESVRAAARIAELEEIVESSATLTAEAKLVTCEGVALDDGVPTGPVGARDAFRPGMVYVFAWVNSPRESETLKFQWLNESGAVQKTQLATIGRNTAGGYRVFKGKQHPSAGSYQVRLYNQSGDLIGRRAFRVL